ncbi:Histone-lysine N-methyltransferase SUVR3 [Rhynchospora pubera]|uniref:Histone-lysine N-methyltransferase SUVR3 n=1 Tax=Rhynchospora pubera TaxID=906938 RepID=A0AAV8DBV2_9POAL|nr:Histone-lysine N-methyltransferase SUVR3 [Rhynchospora pubera]
MRRENLTDEQLLYQWASLVLPYLSPRDLAASACACRTLSLIASGVTSRRTADAARGLERYPIPFGNATASPQPYSYFLYTPHPILSPSPSSSFSQSWGGEGTRGSATDCERLQGLRSCFGGFEVGCDCDRCEEGRCSCWSDMELGVLKECGENCACGLTCENRRTRSGIPIRLKIVRDARKGWSLHAAEAIRRGDFVCEYAGEYLTTEEAQIRLKTYDELSLKGTISPALLVVREHLPSGKACLRVNIDATKIGNAARFINHSCDGGNLKLLLVRNSGSLLPRLCFFASVDISEDEELSFSYGASAIKENSLPCFCGSANCSGVLPSEET